MNPITFLMQAMGYGFDQGNAMTAAMRQPQDGRRGMDDPRIVNPNDPRPRVAPAPAAVPALPEPVEVGPAPGMAPPVLAGAMSAPDTSPDNIDAGGGYNPASAPASAPQQPGILSQVGGYLGKLQDAGFFNALGNGLMSAGSQDPAKTLAMLQTADAETAKVAQARRKALQGETKHIKGALFGVYGPDGSLVRTFVDPTAGKYEAETREAEADAAKGKQVNAAVLQELVKKEIERLKGTTDAAGGATSKPEFSPEVQRKVDNINTLIPKIEGADTIPGGFKNPVIANAIDQTWGRVANTPDYETRRKLDAYLKEGVLADVKTLGTNPSEGDRKFMEKKVPTQDDPTSYKVEYLRELQTRLNEAETRRVAAAQQRDAMGGSSAVRGVGGQTAAPAAPAPAAPAAPQANPNNYPVVNNPADLAKYKGQIVMTPGGPKRVPN